MTFSHGTPFFEPTVTVHSSEALAYRALTASRNGFMIINTLQASYPVDYVNPSFERITGYSERETVGAPFELIFGPDEPCLTSVQLRQAVHQRAEWRRVVQLLHREGHAVWSEINLTPFLDDTGQIHQILVEIADVSERVFTERELRKTALLLSTVVDNLPEMVFLKDAKDLRFELFNKAAEDLLGYRREELIGKTDHDVFPKAQADFFTWKDSEALLDKSLTVICEEWIETRSQGQRILQTKKVPLLDEAGTPMYLLGISEDITEKKQIEKALQDAYTHLEHEVENRTRELAEVVETLKAEITVRQKVETLLREELKDKKTLLDSVPAMIWYKDLNNRIIRANRLAAEAMGVTVEEMEGRNTEDFYPHDAEKFYTDDLEVIQSGLPKLGIIESYVTSSQEQRWVRTDKIPYQDSDGQILGVIVFAVDITKNKRAEEENQLVKDISIAMGEAKNLDTALEIFLKKVCEATGWALGQAWLPWERDYNQLKLSPAWYCRQEAFPQLSQFREAQAALGKEQELPMLHDACALKKPVFVKNFAKRQCYPRSGLADSYQLSSAVAVPIQVNDQLVACLEFFISKDNTAEDQRMVQVVSAIARQLGSLILRKRVEQALAESEQTFRSVFENVMDTLVIMDDAGRILDINRSGLDYVSLPDKELLVGKVPHDFITHRAEFNPSESWQSFIQTFEQSKGEFQFYHPDGTLREIEYNSVPNFLPNHHLSVVRDITDRKNADRKLKKSFERERLLRQIVEVINQSFETNTILERTTQLVGRFFDTDRCSIFQLQPSNADVSEQFTLNSQFCRSQMAHAQDDAAILRQVTPFITTHKVNGHASFSVEIPDTGFHPHKVGRYASTRSCLLYVICFRGEPYGLLSLQQFEQPRTWTQNELDLLENIANHIGVAMYQARLYQEERHAKREAEIANRRKDQFLANMSHEFRTPLNAIIGFAQMLENGFGGQLSSKQERYTQNIVNSGHHLLQMVNDILDIAKIEAGRIKLSISCFLIRSLLKEVVSIFQPMAEEKNIQLRVIVSEEIEFVQADPARLRQILYNLLSNGIKFNRENGEVALVLYPSQDNKWIYCYVQDTGIGIPKEQIPKLFTEFFQVDASSSRCHEGTGLGLALTKKLVDHHGGSIHVDSQPGVGTTFRFSLPWDPEKRPESVQEPSKDFNELPG